VTIAAQRLHARLHLSVADNGAGGPAAPPAPGSGAGLRWLRERLHAVHGEGASVVLERPAGGGCRAQMSLPLQRPPVRQASAPQELVS
jgi:signal transduction histidine kinase